VTSCWEKLGYTGCVETSLGKTESRTQTSATGSDDDSIVLVVLEICPSASHPYIVDSGAFRTYNDGVFVAN
jgi:hypothetical protein